MQQKYAQVRIMCKPYCVFRPEGRHKDIGDTLNGCAHILHGEYIECTGCVHLPQYCPSTLMAARNIAPVLLGQPCNPAILRALGTSHR